MSKVHKTWIDVVAFDSILRDAERHIGSWFHVNPNTLDVLGVLLDLVRELRGTVKTAPIEER